MSSGGRAIAPSAFLQTSRCDVTTQTMIIAVERGLCVCVGVCEALPTLLFKCALHYWVTEGVWGGQD